MEDASSLPTSLGAAMSSTRVRFLLLFFAAGPLFLVPQIDAQDQTGFISIDCGSTGNYTDTVDNTGLSWTTDDGYIRTGVNKNVYAAGQKERLQQLSTARYFPQGRRKSCYILPVKANNSYLIRSTFLHGDLDELVENYELDISIDSTTVESISITDVSKMLTYEHVVTSASSAQQIAFCLIPIVGIPFISSLELRPLREEIYGGIVFQDPLYLELEYRMDSGAGPKSPTVRYPDDHFDRFWTSPFTIWGFDHIDSISTPDDLKISIPDSPPENVMQSAWQDKEFWFIWLVDQSLRHYYILYFQEIEHLNSTDARVLDLLINGGNATIAYRVPADADSLYSNNFKVDANYINFTFLQNPSSTLPPILNAAELFSVHKKVTTTTDPADVSTLNDVRQRLNLLDWTGDPCLPVSWDWLDCSIDEFPRITLLNLSGYQLHGTIPSSIANLTNLSDLWLDGNSLEGPIPNLANLIQLKTLHLQNNLLSGSIPSSLAEIQNLTELFLTNNAFSGPVPPALLQKDGLNLQVDKSFTGGSKAGMSGTVIAAIIVGSVVAIIVALCICSLCRKRWKIKAQNIMASDSGSRGGVQITKAFSKMEVQGATDNFTRQIGEGGFGRVYYGKLDTGQEIAVKVNSNTSGQGPLEFSTEVSLLSRVHHINLLSLVGFCNEGNERILIYEFMQNGTLREHLYGSGMKIVMNWRTRLDVALNAARGLEYLHYDCNPRIMHRDVKSSNVLLNEKMLAKVADFGISKSTPDEDKTKTRSELKSLVRGTFGYIDPEYFSTNKLTYKSDVYSFGVVLFELISARPPIDHQSNSLIDDARQKLLDCNLDAIVDPSLKGTYNLDAMWKLAELAMDCVTPTSKNRPDMRGVVQGLSEAVRFEEEKNSLPVTSRKMTSNFFTPDSTSHLSHPYSHLPEFSDLRTSSADTTGWDSPRVR